MKPEKQLKKENKKAKHHDHKNRRHHRRDARQAFAPEGVVTWQQSVVEGLYWTSKLGI